MPPAVLTFPGPALLLLQNVLLFHLTCFSFFNRNYAVAVPSQLYYPFSETVCLQLSRKQAVPIHVTVTLQSKAGNETLITQSISQVTFFHCTSPVSSKMLFLTSTASPHCFSCHCLFPSRLPVQSKALSIGPGVDVSSCCPHPLSEAHGMSFLAIHSY
uniref:Secreted protein n=1 Tax=Strigops habroptila TaxID=2489341 RepID=A0A672V3V6_STRHB